MFAALCNGDPISCAPITRVAYLVLVSNIAHRPYLMLLVKSWSLIFVRKISSCHPRWDSSKYVHAMANYQISRAFPQDILQIAAMSSSFVITDLLTNAMLRDPSDVSWNSLESRRVIYASHGTAQLHQGTNKLCACRKFFYSQVMQPCCAASH